VRRAPLAAAAVVLSLAAARGPAAAAEPVVLEGPAAVHEVLREDFDGDGIRDLIAVEGRTLFVWRGREGALPAAAPTRTVLADDVSAVDVLGKGAWLAFGRSGAQRVVVGEDGASRPAEPLAVPVPPLAWRDGTRANFADFVRGDRLVLPAQGGWWLGDAAGAGFAFAVRSHRVVTASGWFLEDSAKVEDGLPHVVTGAPFVVGGPPSLWALSGDALVGQAGDLRATYDLSFVRPTGDRSERRLVDMDGDDVPDVVHGDGTNQEQKLAFFRTPPPKALPDGTLAPTGSLRPPVAVLRLTGYPLDPATVDLDGDGARDFVLTSIEIDTANVVRALGGKVTAHTRAFRNRRTPGRLFGAEPDAVITSDIGVRIRFGYTGNIDIQRSFTIVTGGDYDGDGRLDLAIREGFDALRVRRGTAEGVWEPEGRRVAIPPMGERPDLDAFPVDLTGDRRDELVLVYRAPPGGRDRVVVLDLGSS
jgi:hypothetical protein